MPSIARSGDEAAIENPIVRDRIAGRVRLTRLEHALDWATSLAPAPWRVATSCCAMSLAQDGDLFEALGTGPPVVSARAADLLIVAGSITQRQAPILRAMHARMVAPRWVIAWGVCAISGGAYQNYATLPGLSTILPVDVHVVGCPPAPEDLRAALTLLRERSGRDSGTLHGSSERGWLPIEEQRAFFDPSDPRSVAGSARSLGFDSDSEAATEGDFAVEAKSTERAHDS